MELNKRQLDVVHRLRCKYADTADNGHAHDALMYYLLSDGGKNVAGIGKKIQKAMAFYKSVKGERFYHQLSDHLSSRKDTKTRAHVDVDDVNDIKNDDVNDMKIKNNNDDDDHDDDDVYDFSPEMAKAAKKKNGHLLLKPGSVSSPEEIALEALSNFSKTI